MLVIIPDQSEPFLPD